MLYFIWQAGQLSNKQIGNLFGISYSAVSHTVRSVKTKIKKDQKLEAEFSQLNSLFNGLLPK
jgi:chromosomal replication initiation ATPase DnaA